jgi:hypothetical protein
MNRGFYRDLLRQHGAGALFFHVAYRAANRVLDLRVWNTLVITMDTIDARILAESRNVGVRMLEARAMDRYADDPEYDLTRRTLEEAVARGDRCAAIFDGETLASYGWYATQPIRLLEIPGAPLLHFDPAYAYMYNGFTHRAYRGRRLHALGMAAALRGVHAGRSRRARELRRCDELLVAQVVPPHGLSELRPRGHLRAGHTPALRRDAGLQALRLPHRARRRLSCGAGAGEDPTRNRGPKQYAPAQTLLTPGG